MYEHISNTEQEKKNNLGAKYGNREDITENPNRLATSEKN